MRLIDADALFKHKVAGVIGNLSGDYVPGFAIATAPTIETEPVRHGRWEFLIDGYYCSECDCKLRKIKRKPKYCEHCGAKMDGKEEPHEAPRP